MFAYSLLYPPLFEPEISNFVRGMIYESGLFDVSNAVAGQRVFAAFGKPTWS